MILCAPAPNNAFAYGPIRNLMQLMSFGELGGQYDLVLMDLREVRGEPVSKIIWRRYTNLPQIPLVAESSRDTSRGIEAMKARVAGLGADDRQRLDALLAALADAGVMATEGPQGYDLKWQDTGKSLYVRLKVSDDGWHIVRHQVRSGDALYNPLNEYDDRDDIQPGPLAGLGFDTERKTSTVGDGFLWNVTVDPNSDVGVDELVQRIQQLAYQPVDQGGSNAEGA